MVRSVMLRLVHVGAMSARGVCEAYAEALVVLNVSEDAAMAAVAEVSSWDVLGDHETPSKRAKPNGKQSECINSCIAWSRECNPCHPDRQIGSTTVGLTPS